MSSSTNNVFKKKQTNWPKAYEIEDPIPLTAETFAALKKELDELFIEQEEVVERVKVAREMGDLSENGAYKYGKFELGKVRRRMGEIKKLLRLGVVIEKKQDGKINFGSEVTLEGPQGKRRFLLVSEHESDPTKGKLSDKSPIGSAVKGKCVGDKVQVELPLGLTEFTIVDIN